MLSGMITVLPSRLPLTRLSKYHVCLYFPAAELHFDWYAFLIPLTAGS